jgi:hypothetical protein
MKQEIIDKVNELSKIKESILRFLEDDSVLIGKGSYSKYFDCFVYRCIEDEVFTEQVNELAKKRLNEIEKEIEEL